MNYIDLFHGIGGFALGAYWAGMRFENHFCSDIEPYAQKLYKLRFPESIQIGDITNDYGQRFKEQYNGITERPRDFNGCDAGRKAEHSGWSVEPAVGRLVNGLPGRVDRLKGLGNSIVPQIAELLFNQIKSVATSEPRKAS